MEQELERLNTELNDSGQLAAYKEPYDNYPVSGLPRALGKMLVFCGNFVYGEEPSYLKFRAVEVIARVPYHSWSAAAFTLLTYFYRDEERAMKLMNVAHTASYAQDNETMHVVVISTLAKKEQPANPIVHTFIPMLFAFFYYWASYFLYLMNPRWSHELNYMFEQHAFDQYDRFLREQGDMLNDKPIMSEFLEQYGRNFRSQYEFFRSVRNDELIHRNRSIHEIEAMSIVVEDSPVTEPATVPVAVDDRAGERGYVGLIVLLLAVGIIGLWFVYGYRAAPSDTASDAESTSTTAYGGLQPGQYLQYQEDIQAARDIQDTVNTQNLNTDTQLQLEQ